LEHLAAEATLAVERRGRAVEPGPASVITPRSEEAVRQDVLEELER
jgi:hypothetical protein